MINLSVEEQDFVEYISEQIIMTESTERMVRDYFKLIETTLNSQCTDVCCLEPKKSAGCKIEAPCQKQETDMNYATTAVSIAADLSAADKDQRRFLRSRLEDAFYDKKTALKKRFGLTGDERPQSFEDLLARIQAGKYVIEEKDAKKKSYDPLSWIVWRDPSIKEDQAGYDAAKAELRKAYDKAEEDIRILALTDGLAALRAFKDISVQ